MIRTKFLVRQQFALSEVLRPQSAREIAKEFGIANYDRSFAQPDFRLLNFPERLFPASQISSGAGEGRVASSDPGSGSRVCYKKSTCRQCVAASKVKTA